MSELKLDHLSPSSLDTWFLCQRKFLYQHLLRIPTPYSWPAFGGTLYHNALEYFYYHKAMSTTPVKPKEILEHSREFYDQTLEEQEVVFEDNEPENVWKTTMEGVKIHIEKRGKFILPAKVEGEPQIEITVTKPIPNHDTVSVTGRIDLLTKSKIIIDHKTRNMKKYTKKLTINSMRSKHAPEIYRFLMPEAEDINWEVTLLYVEDKNKKPYPYTLQYPPYNQIKYVGLYLNNVAKQIEQSCQSGIFIPSTIDNYLCNEKYCGFWDICQGGVKDA